MCALAVMVNGPANAADRMAAAMMANFFKAIPFVAYSALRENGVLRVVYAFTPLFRLVIEKPMMSRMAAVSSRHITRKIG